MRSRQKRNTSRIKRRWNVVSIKFKSKAKIHFGLLDTIKRCNISYVSIVGHSFSLPSSSSSFFSFLLSLLSHTLRPVCYGFWKMSSVFTFDPIDTHMFVLFLAIYFPWYMIAYFNEATDFTVEWISTVSFPLYNSINVISEAKRSIIFINSEISNFEIRKIQKPDLCISLCLKPRILRSMTLFHLVCWNSIIYASSISWKSF